jgi:death-on-curing protein
VDFGNESSVAVLGAALAWALLRNHPFIDGNKRAAFAALVMFLDLNGYQLTCTEVEETAMMLRATASDINEEDWMAWVERNVAPIAH